MAPDLDDSVDHMYLDINSNVTVGIGTLLPNASAATSLAFRHRNPDAPATAEEIGDEYDLLDAMTNTEGFSAAY